MSKTKLCNKKIKKFGRWWPCVREKNHGGGRNGGGHSPNLTGLILGKAKVIRMGKPKFNCGSPRRTWVLEFPTGYTKTVLLTAILNGRNRGEHAGISSQNGKRCLIYPSVVNHWMYIFRRQEKSYKNMPFYDDWNPRKGGSFYNGVKWIKDNLGQRQKNYDLHIIDRKIGFWPGNLAWIPASNHRQEELINKLLLENKNLRDQLARKK